MKINIEHLLIIGDELSQRHDNSESRVDSEMQVVSLYDSDDEKAEEDQNIAEIINTATVTRSLAWFDYLMDSIFYTMNQLDSSLSFSSKPKDEVNNLNLEYYLETYISSRLTIDQNTTESTSYTSFSRPELSNLVQIDKTLEQKQFPSTRKAKTLVLEWVGLHDLKNYISKEAEDLSTDDLVSRYIEHLTRLIKLGYKNFCIMGPIHTHLTSGNESKVSLYNINLQTELSELQSTYPDCKMTFIDVQSNLERSGITINEDLRLSPEAQQAISASLIEQAIEPNYNFILPELILLARFKKAFHTNWQASKNGHLGFLVGAPSINYLSASLSEIFAHAKSNLRSRTAEVLKDLGWIRISGAFDKKATCISNQPLIKSIWENPRSITNSEEYR